MCKGAKGQRGTLASFLSPPLTPVGIMGEESGNSFAAAGLPVKKLAELRWYGEGGGGEGELFCQYQHGHDIKRNKNAACAVFREGRRQGGGLRVG